jgi:hypothetical protein
VVSPHTQNGAETPQKCHEGLTSKFSSSCSILCLVGNEPSNIYSPPLLSAPASCLACHAPGKICSAAASWHCACHHPPHPEPCSLSVDSCEATSTLIKDICSTCGTQVHVRSRAKIPPSLKLHALLMQRAPAATRGALLICSANTTHQQRKLNANRTLLTCTGNSTARTSHQAVCSTLNDPSPNSQLFGFQSAQLYL